jgi:S-adenosylmethionine-dependent methyltransferase
MDEAEAWALRNETPWGRLQRELLSVRLFNWLGALPGSVLDFGCGFAELGIAFAAQGARVMAVDRSEAMLSVARSRAATASTSVTFKCADLDDGLDGYGTFDLVIGHFIVGYADHPRGAVAALVSAVAPGGSLSLAVTNPIIRPVRAAVFDRDLDAALALARHDDGRLDGPCGDVAAIEPTTLKRWLSDAGATIEHQAGMFVVNTYLANDLKYGDDYPKLFELEMLLGEREFLREVGGMTHLLARTDPGTPTVIASDVIGPTTSRS